MLAWSASFFVIALIAALIGFGNLAEGSQDIAKVLFVVFLVLTAISLLLGLFRRGSRY